MRAAPSQSFLQNAFLLKNRQKSTGNQETLLQLLETRGHGLGGLRHSRTLCRHHSLEGRFPDPVPTRLDTGWNTQRPWPHCPQGVCPLGARGQRQPCHPSCSLGAHTLASARVRDTEQLRAGRSAFRKLAGAHSACCWGWRAEPGRVQAGGEALPGSACPVQAPPRRRAELQMSFQVRRC